MWWLLDDGDAINANSVDRVITGGTGETWRLFAYIGDAGYQLAGGWSTEDAASATLRRLTNALDASTL